LNRGSVNEGIVGLKILSNELIAILYSNGTFRIWSAYTRGFIIEDNLLDKVHNE
jgi:hypothetical protein